MQGLAPKNEETTRQYEGKSTRQAVAKRLRHFFFQKLIFHFIKKSLKAPPSPPPFFNVDTL